ncbi:MAG: hypothetical protein AB1468_06835 [Candidatus Micrarchaeota archaeon]
MDLLDIFRFSYSWISDNRSWKWYGALLAIVLVMVTLIAVFFPLPTGATDSQDFAKKFESLSSSAAISAVLGVFVVSLIGSLAIMYVSANIAINALDSKKIPAQPFDFNRYLSYIWLHVLNAIYIFFSLYNTRFLLIPAAALVLFLLSIAMQFLILAGMVVFGAYMVVVVYNAIRLSVAVPIFLSRKLARTSDALAESWKITEGRVIEVLVTNILTNIIWGIIMLIPGLIPIVNFIISPISNFYGEYIRVGIYDALGGGAGEEKVRKKKK